MYDKYGRESADKDHMIGAGPYRLKELIPGQRLVIAKNPNHPEAKKHPGAPDEVVYRIMREPEQRVTALLNDEIQIGQFVPPHMRQRVEKINNLRITSVDSVEIMFLAMQPKPPFDKKEVRQAVCHAINRDQIIGTLLEGFASRLDGPLGPGQYGYDPKFEAEIELRPGKSQKTFGPSRLCQRHRCRAANSGGTLHLGQAANRSDGPDAQLLPAFAPSSPRPSGRRSGRTCKRARCLSITWDAARSRIRAPHCINTFIQVKRRASAIPIQSRRTAEQRTARVRPEKTAPISVAGDEHPDRRRAGLFHVAAQTALGLEHQD